jgi:NDP-sugar pyrophosphorylase family protein
VGDTAEHISVRQAVILAGGQATRLRPYTDDRPKAMVEIAGKPILDWQLEWLSASGVTDVVVSCGYLADVLEEHVGTRSHDGTRVRVAVESEPLGRGGALRFAAERLPFPEERWFALNGDVLTRLPLRAMAERHMSAQVKATVALAQYRTTWGVATLGDHGMIVGFEQSPHLPYWINGGVYCFDADVAAMLPERGDHEDSTFPKLAEEKQIAGFQIATYWRGVDTVKDIKEATAELAEIGW